MFTAFVLRTRWASERCGSRSRLAGREVLAELTRARTRKSSVLPGGADDLTAEAARRERLLLNAGAPSELIRAVTAKAPDSNVIAEEVAGFSFAAKNEVKDLVVQLEKVRRIAAEETSQLRLQAAGMQTELEDRNARLMASEGVVNERDLIEYIERLNKPDQGFPYEHKDESLRSWTWRWMMKKKPNLRECLRKQAKWPAAQVPFRVANMYRRLSNALHPSTPDMPPSNVMLYRDPLDKEEVAALRCMCEAHCISFKIVKPPAKAYAYLESAGEDEAA